MAISQLNLAHGIETKNSFTNSKDMSRGRLYRMIKYPIGE